MKLLLSLALIIISLTVSASNTPYPCGTYQQGGKLCPDGNLYPYGNCSSNGYYHPKKDTDYWVYVGTINYSPNWWYLACGNNPEELPIDLHVIILLLIVGLYSVFKIKGNVNKPKVI